ncbi:MAG TPA: hypothetical protein VH913_26520 [Hyphomicrobiaceae bacterium]|jgi:hypothetical protein
MRRVVLIAVSLLASAVLVLLLVPAPRASALTAADLGGGLRKGVAGDNGVQLVRRGGGGFRGGGFHGGRAFQGGHAFRGGRAFAFRGGHVARGGYAFRGGRAFAFRGGPRHGWRRGWRGPGWGWGVGAAALAAPYYYGSYGRCPLVRRTVWTPHGWRVRWVRRCW